MPAVLDKMVGKLKAKGKPTGNAFAIATSALQKSGHLKPGSIQPTGKGRGMIPGKGKQNA